MRGFKGEIWVDEKNGHGLAVRADLANDVHVAERRRPLRTSHAWFPARFKNDAGA